MAYKERLDGRAFDETRPIEAKVGVIKKARGSAFFRMGKTAAYAAVYGPRDLFPRFLKDPKSGVLRCHYNMLPFSTTGERVRPGPSRRSREISMVTEKALKPVLDLSEYPNSVLDVFIDLPETDAGSRCAGICAASLALADAGVRMKDMVVAVATGVIDGQIVLDLSYDEEAFEGEVADIPLALLPRTGQVTLLQMDGKASKEQLLQAIELAKKKAPELYEVQKKALKEKFENGEEK
ncbi:exosome complex exonuclease Rrp41 [Candidatus Woesearchaeota archaeon]|nr:exosome complex exonuclease Rrp41 [Candidatus Woesearchaeota archaeon]MBW3017205.1 exosome complex exonuclease Rrp41 [Candidatus Woesearchaeota archaeon]